MARSPETERSTDPFRVIVTSVTNFHKVYEVRFSRSNSQLEGLVGMRNNRSVERLISERWPQLKKRAENETLPEKLIAILDEIDDLLFCVEMRIAAQSGLVTRRSPSALSH
jgi:hypothetical protein